MRNEKRKCFVSECCGASTRYLLRTEAGTLQLLGVLTADDSKSLTMNHPSLKGAGLSKVKCASGVQ